MDFFAHQDKARKRTASLVFLFLLSVVLIVGAVCFLFIMVMPEFFHASYDSYGTGVFPVTGSFSEFFSQLHWENLGAVAAVVAGIILLASLFKSAELGTGGGKMLAERMGGRLVSTATEDPDEKRLLNVVEEMALASGISVPEVYVMHGEQGLNAFAAGWSVQNAVIGVTEGLLRQLDRNELQGVIAHEVGHIVQGDMRLNLRLIGILFGILFLQQLGYFILHGSGMGGRKRDNSALLGLGLLVLGSIGYFFGSWMKAAVSRQREFFADASAVQFTRFPKGIANALRKIAAEGSLMESPRASETSHMFFANGVSGLFSSMFSTHPPIDQRVGRIEGTSQVSLEKVLSDGSSKAAAGAEGMVCSFSSDSSSRTSYRNRTQPSAQEFIGSAGSPTPKSLSLASAFIRNLPDDIRINGADSFSARCLIYCILMHPGHEERKIQLAVLEPQLNEAENLLILKLLPQVMALGKCARLPILDLAMPVLKSLSTEQRNAFLDVCYSMVKADTWVDVFEYVLFRLLQTQLLSAKRVRELTGMVGEIPLPRAIKVVLGVLASQGQSTDQAARKAYEEGSRVWGISGSSQEEPGKWDPLLFDTALRKIHTLNFKEKGRFMLACATVVAHDGMVSLEEAEIIRVVSGFLGCPIPAF